MDTITHAKRLANSLIEKMAWESQCKPLLKAFSINTGLGTEATKSKLFGEFEKSEVYAQRFIQQLTPYYNNLLFSGDRTLKIFRLKKDRFQTVYDKFITSTAPESIAVDYFPYVVPNDCLDNLSTSTTLTNQSEYNGKLYAFFSTNRAITERSNIDPKRLNETEDVKRFLQKYSMVTVFSENPRQYIDVICLNPEDCTIELRLDTSSAVAFRDIDKLFIELQDAFLQTLSCQLDFAVFVHSVNFFQYISSLYSDIDCRVCELNFVSADGYVHSERDRNKARGGDVRNGNFHIGGVEKCDITPYKISARWNSNFTKELKYEYELSLNSTFRELSKLDGGFLDYAVISLCPTVSDMDNILNILKQNDELSKAS